jgi:hypothetical protein
MQHTNYAGGGLSKIQEKEVFERLVRELFPHLYSIATNSEYLNGEVYDITSGSKAKLREHLEKFDDTLAPNEVTSLIMKVELEIVNKLEFARKVRLIDDGTLPGIEASLPKNIVSIIQKNNILTIEQLIIFIESFNLFCIKGLGPSYAYRLVKCVYDEIETYFHVDETNKDAIEALLYGEHEDEKVNEEEDVDYNETTDVSVVGEDDDDECEEETDEQECSEEETSGDDTNGNPEDCQCCYEITKVHKKGFFKRLFEKLFK